MAVSPISSDQLFTFIIQASNPKLTRDSAGDIINTSQPLTGANLAEAISHLVSLVQIERADVQTGKHLDALKLEKEQASMGRTEYVPNGYN